MVSAADDELSEIQQSAAAIDALCGLLPCVLFPGVGAGHGGWFLCDALPECAAAVELLPQSAGDATGAFERAHSGAGVGAGAPAHRGDDGGRWCGADDGVACERCAGGKSRGCCGDTFLLHHAGISAGAGGVAFRWSAHGEHDRSGADDGGAASQRAVCGRGVHGNLLDLYEHGGQCRPLGASHAL